jgi:hypothetical protein
MEANMKQTYTINELSWAVLDTNLPTQEKKVLLNEIRKLRTGQEDRWIFRTVVWILGAVAIVVVLYPLIIGKPLPDGLLSLGSAAVGALAAFLTPSLMRTPETQAEGSGTQMAPEPLVTASVTPTGSQAAASTSQ